MQTHRERQAVGADPGLPGQRVWRGWSAGRCWDEECSPRKGGGTGGSPVPCKCTAHSGRPFSTCMSVCLSVWDQFWDCCGSPAVYLTQLFPSDDQKLFTFHVRFRIMTGCRAVESNARGTILILFSYWPTASASHGALQKTSFTWKRSWAAPDITGGIS